jgi:hypothetical protein
MSVSLDHYSNLLYLLEAHLPRGNCTHLDVTGYSYLVSNILSFPFHQLAWDLHYTCATDLIVVIASRLNPNREVIVPIRVIKEWSITLAKVNQALRLCRS